jgi:nucleoside-diphosphate-sugar epimerase
MSRKVFLTGCTGEVGSRLTLNLLRNGYEVFGTRGSKQCGIDHARHTCSRVDLLDPYLDLELQTIKPDLLIHTAWITTPKDFWESESNFQWVEASKKVIGDFEKAGGQKIIVTGSCAEYSWSSNSKLTEDSPTFPTSKYGKSKVELLHWTRDRGVPFLWTRTFFQFGMNEKKGRLIPGVIDSLLKGEKFQIHSSSDIRDFVFTEDVSEVLSHLISKDLTGEINIGSGYGVEIGVVTRKIAEMLNREDLLNIEEITKPSSYVVADTEKLNSILGGYPWTPIETALIRTIEARRLQ